MAPHPTVQTPTAASTRDTAAATPARAAARASYARAELIRMDVMSTAANPFRADGDATTLRDS